MKIEDFLEEYKPLIRKNILSIILASLGLILLGYGLIGLIGSSSSSNDIVFESSENTSSSSAKIFIDIEGAVVKAGVYELSSDSRLQDALVAAGGLSLEANRDFVAKNFNLAQKLKDGAKIYVPGIGEEAGTARIDATGQVQGTASININSASLSELDTLPGVGSVIGQKIIDSRPYESIEDLLSKKVLGSSVFEKIKDKITVY